MRSALLLIVAVLVASTGAHAQADPKIAAVSEEYGRCVQRAAIALSIGPDAADLIARTAVLYCENEGRAVTLAWGPGREAIETGMRYLDHLEKQSVQLATKAILQQRAAMNKK